MFFKSKDPSQIRLSEIESYLKKKFSKELDEERIIGNVAEEVENALEDSVKLNREEIPTNRLKDNKVTVYAFGDIAEQYGRFLENVGISLEGVQKETFFEDGKYKDDYIYALFENDWPKVKGELERRVSS